MAEYSLVLFDGVCNMCNGFAVFVLARDKKEIFRFASLQSPLGLSTLERLGIPCDLSTVVLVEPGDTFYTKSTAILRILSQLTFPFYLASSCLYVPAVVRDFGYWCVASSRYQVFGKKDVCEYRPEWSDRFLAESPAVALQRNTDLEKLC
eukprot:TRINITY_DN15766_c0_g1_i1.p1 TRINITY_DN15766_c0_g1~~TRINITY_DN15766_c0_g1_i1.p1  ORF type:complete len:150 (-),score=12.24 TRINITY_DN15766_c0_g1_i1:40-489(-)